MRLYKKYCFSSKDYEECEKITEICAETNEADYIIEVKENECVGYILVEE